MKNEEIDATKRLEPALRFLAKNPNWKVADVAIKFGFKNANVIWDWLGAHNHSRKELPEHIIDGVLAGLIYAAPAAGIDRQPGRPRGASRQEQPAAPLAKPEGNIGAWLESQKAQITARVNCFQVSVSPELALSWLRLNRGNRTPSRCKIHRFSAAMRAGRWMLNGETIKLSGTGRLLDGQSRLMAIAEADVPVILEIRGGLPDLAQRSMDIGESRKTAHTLEMMGRSHPFEMGAALKIVWLWERDLLAGNKFRQSSVMENFELPALIERHARLGDSLAWAVSTRRTLEKILVLSEASALHYLFGMAHAKKRDTFFDALISGIGLARENPVYHLRECLLDDRCADARMDKVQRRGLILKAWALHFANQRCRALIFTRKGDGAEAFPEIAGLSRPRIAA